MLARIFPVKMRRLPVSPLLSHLPTPHPYRMKTPFPHQQPRLKQGDLAIPETVGAPPIRQIDDYIRQGYTNIQIEDILEANKLPRHRKLIQDER
jgi:hypothetical protein